MTGSSIPFLNLVSGPETGNEQGRVLKSPEQLVTAGLLTADEARQVGPLSKRYAISVTPQMVGQIAVKNDPVARQFVPMAGEAVILPQEMRDPIGDNAHAPVACLVHRYSNRVLFKLTQACAVYCRFCFRREMIGPNAVQISNADIDAAMDYIAKNKTIHEVIFTGGDPLVVGNKTLSRVLQQLENMPHIKWVRFHTRVPVVASHLITPAVIKMFAGYSKPVLMALHINHAREISPIAIEVIRQLHKAGLMLLGQSVLLKGVNADIKDLTELFETMMQLRIKPYYLHHPDLTVGTGHFRLSFEDGMALMQELERNVSGVCLPRYVLDIPGGVAKIDINRQNITPIENKPGHYNIRDPDGGWRSYSDILPG